jgi:hypothetical protein
MDIQVQRSRSPLVLRADTVTLKRIAGMVGGKGDAPDVYVVSVMTGVRIVIHQVNIVRADSSSQ